jgi:hypothetical protein
MERSTILIGLLVFFALANIYGQKEILEEKALKYFCENINEIQEGITNYNLQFSGKTEGVAGSIFLIADCFGEISLIKNEIPNEAYLDSIYESNKKLSFVAKKVRYDCDFIKKHVFSKESYKLRIFETVEYKNAYYVEIYLIDNQKNAWIFCVKFDRNKELAEHCMSFFSL